MLSRLLLAQQACQHARPRKNDVSGPRVHESYSSDTIPSMKIAISLPDPIFEAAEHLAEELRIPRSQLYAEALASYLNIHGGAANTAKLNEVHGSNAVPVELALAKMQLRIPDREAW